MTTAATEQETMGARGVLEAAVQQLSEEIAVRMDAMLGLQRCLGIDEMPPRVSPVMEESKGPGGRPPSPRSKAGKAKRSTVPGTNAAERVYNVALTLDSPFTLEELDKAAGLGRSGSLYHIRNKLKGKFRCVREGRPGTPASWEVVRKGRQDAAAPKHIPGLDREPEPQTRAEIEAAIETACRERDQARGAGREAMATILQSKVEKLQRQLGD